MIIYGLKNCDKCRAALKTLSAQGWAAELIDIRDVPLSQDALSSFYAQFGAPMMNTRSTTWRGLSEDERNSEPLALLTAHPTLIKRPIIAAGDKLTLGWTKEIEADWQAALT